MCFLSADTCAERPFRLDVPQAHTHKGVKTNEKDAQDDISYVH